MGSICIALMYACKARSTCSAVLGSKRDLKLVSARRKPCSVKRRCSLAVCVLTPTAKDKSSAGRMLGWRERTLASFKSSRYKVLVSCLCALQWCSKAALETEDESLGMVKRVISVLDQEVGLENGLTL